LVQYALPTFTSLTGEIAHTHKPEAENFMSAPLQICNLLPTNSEPPAQPVTTRILHVRASQDDGIGGVFVRRGLLDERLLTSVHETTLEFDLVTTRLAPDNPFLTAEQIQRLDALGLILTGSVVHTGDVLASIVDVPQARPGRPAGAPGMQDVRDFSEIVPPEWDGARVEAVRHLARGELGRDVPRTVLERIQVDLRVERDLAVGDVLLVESAPLGVVAGILDDAEMANAGQVADVVAPPSMGRRLGLTTAITSVKVGKAAERAVDVLRARSMEVYSLISLQPLARSLAPGQAITAEQVRWLRSRGLNGILAELLSLKSDDLRNRTRLRELLAASDWAPDDVPQPGGPESLAIFRAWLMALGLEVQLERQPDHVTLTLRPARSQDILAWSSGPIIRPETLNYKTYEDLVGGLFCPQLFGLTGTARRRRFGHLLLASPIVPFLWRAGSPSVLEKLLDLPARDIERIVRYKASIHCSGAQVEVIPEPSDALPHESGEWISSGGAAIQALLQRVPSERIPRALVGRIDALIQTVLPVVPPDLRPLILLDSGNFATSDLNDLYRAVINRSNRLRKLEELRAPLAILLNERRELQAAVDNLQANCFVPKSIAKPREGAQNERLIDCLSMVVRHVRDGQKRVDWSARARAVSSPAVAHDQVLLPSVIFEKLRLNLSEPVLVASPDSADGRWIALRPWPHAEAVVALSDQAYRDLGLFSVTAPVCVVHRPLTRQAVEEAEKLLRGEPGAVVRVPEQTGWVDGDDEQAVLAGLVEAAVHGQPVRLQSPRGLLVAGTGAVDFATDEEIQGSPA
jgi:hypothetical protein